MKLEGELAFLHSNVCRKPESQSIELNDDDQNSAGYKLHNQKVKEYGNKVSIYSKNEEDLDPSSYEMEPAERMTTPKHDLTNSEIDLKSDYEAHVFDLVEPVSHLSSEEIESFIKFPDDMESVQRSPTTPISNPPQEIDSFEKPVDVYMDKTVTECEPELVVCFKESIYHVVKDICVDEGVNNKDKVILKNNADAMTYNPFLSETYENEEKLEDNAGNNVLDLHLSNLSASEQSDQDKFIFKNSADVKAYNPFLSESYETEENLKENSGNNLSNLSASEQSEQDKVILKNSADVKSYNPFLSESYDSDEKLKESVGNNLLNLLASEKSDQVPANNDQLKDLMHKDAEVSEKLGSNVIEGMVSPEGKVLLRELDTAVPSDDKGEQVSADGELRSQSEDSRTIAEEAVLATPNSASVVNESNSDSLVLENGNSSNQIDSSAPADCGKMECHESGACRCDETQHKLNPVEEKFDDDQRITSQVRNSVGESSFSAVGPVSSRISYSGPVPYSGSISLRSDSSTTSTRSFAFPVLQSEWNSSPVRMAKADRGRYRKHRGWRHGLLCCKF